MKTTPRVAKPRKHLSRLVTFNLAMAGFAVLTVAVLFLCIVTSGGGKGYNLLLMGLGCFAVGAFMGFLYGTMGVEADRFKNIGGILNGLIGGFAISDLMKDESLIRRLLHALSRSAGRGDDVAVAGSVMASFGILGFLVCYVNKTLALNLELNEVQKRLDPARKLVAQAAEAAKGERGEAIGGLEPARPAENLAQESPLIKSAVNELMASAELAEDGSAEAEKTRGMACFVAGDLKAAELQFAKALKLDPDDPESLSYLAQILVGGRPEAAIPHLERLRALGSDEPQLSKWLGYAYLWRKDKLDDAIRESLRYLGDHPGDLGAKLNLTCAYAQQGPSDITKPLVFRYVKELVDASPAARDRILQLMNEPDGDFSAWKGEERLVRLLQPPVAAVRAGSAP